MLATRSSREWPYRVTELGASGASFSVTSIYVPHGSVRNAIFVRVFGTPKLPEIQFSLNTNYCDIGFCLAPDGQRLIIVSCEDNLIKGAAGQAIQNMNLMFGFQEEEGLI